MKKQEAQKKQTEITCPDENISPEEMKQEILRLREELALERAQKDFIIGALEALPNPIFIKDSEGNFTYFNPKYEEFFKMKREDFLGKNALSLLYLPKEDRTRYHSEDLDLIRDSAILHYEIDFPQENGGNRPSFYWSRGFVSPKNGERGLVGEIVDITKERNLEIQLKNNITQLEQANAVIAAASKIDAMTGIYNRRILNELIEPLLSGNGQPNLSFCFLMADLDHFKSVNDTFGHLTYDEILAEFAKILKDSCRENDFPIRFGGEEFLLFLHRVDLADAGKIAERIRKKTSEELLLPNGKNITASFGIAQYRYGEDLNHCLERADEALYRAKETGRNKVVTECDLS